MLRQREGKQEAWITSGERSSIYGFLLSSLFSPFPRNSGIKNMDWCQKILHLGAREQHREILGNPSQAQKGEHWQEHLLWRPLMTECLVTAVKSDCPDWCITLRIEEVIWRAWDWALLIVLPGRCPLHSFGIQAFSDWLQITLWPPYTMTGLWVSMCTCVYTHTPISIMKYLILVNSDK